VRVFAVWLALAAAAPAETFSKELWRGIETVYGKTLEHPFLRGLTDGTLPRARFQ